MAGSEWNLVTRGESPETAAGAHDSIQRGLYYDGYQRWFGVLFFYLLLGPAGALAYRLLHLCRDSLEPALCARVLHVLDWVPVRLVAAFFVITGDFVASRDALAACLADRETDAGTVLSRVGNAAVGVSAVPVGDNLEFGRAAAAQNRAGEELLSRSAGAWVIAISLVELLPAALGPPHPAGAPNPLNVTAPGPFPGATATLLNEPPRQPAIQLCRAGTGASRDRNGKSGADQRPYPAPR